MRQQPRHDAALVRLDRDHRIRLVEQGHLVVAVEQHDRTVGILREEQVVHDDGAGCLRLQRERDRLVQEGVVG